MEKAEGGLLHLISIILSREPILLYYLCNFRKQLKEKRNKFSHFFAMFCGFLLLFDPEAMVSMSPVTWNSPLPDPHGNMEDLRAHLVIHFLPYLKWWLLILIKEP